MVAKGLYHRPANYTLGSGLAVFANSAAMLIGLRFFQGLGAAMFVTTGMAIITSIFPPNRRGRVIGVYVAAVLSVFCSTFTGGILTHYLGWRSIFLIMLPIGLLVLFLTIYYLKGKGWENPGKG